MAYPNPEQHTIFKRIDNKVKWRVAKAYRDGMLAKVGEANARWAAIRTMESFHPEFEMKMLQSIVAYIIVQAAQNHLAWMRGGAQKQD